MNVLIVGGSFGIKGGNHSSIINKLYYEMYDSGIWDNVTLFNGGYYSDLERFLQESKKADATLWFANVPNDLPKIRDVKKINPYTILVGSKRNNGEYSFQDLMNRALGQKMNLLVEFSKNTTGSYQFALYDPLGVEWYKGEDIVEFTKVLNKRLKFLVKVTRLHTIQSDGNIDYINIPVDEEFFEHIKNCAEIFHTLIEPAENVERFLGNSSFRCKSGFPSFKKDGLIYVSARNIDKRYIDQDNFIPTYMENGKIYYYGARKPSVDTPIQLRLYQHYPKINYMLHSHCYIKDAVFTHTPIPCGGLEEVGEITSITNDGTLNFYTFNLIGHGSLVMATTVEQMKSVEYYARPIPEVL